MVQRAQGVDGEARAVAIGGGHGLARTLRALRGVVGHVTAVVTVADDGGSSGRLRRDLGVLPPGDLRMALAALTPREDLAGLLQYRFGRGELDGHSLGNLVLVALAELADGDLVAALARAARLLEIPGQVLPCTEQQVQLCGRTDREEIVGQATLARTRGIERVWLEPSAPAATPAAVEAVERADLVVLGPGSLYTSLLPNLLVPDLGAAVARARCPVVFVANLREQPGETEGMELPAHLAALTEHVPAMRPSVLLAHEGADPRGPGAPLRADRRALVGQIPRVLTRPLLDGTGGHAPAALGEALAELLEGR